MKCTMDPRLAPSVRKHRPPGPCSDDIANLLRNECLQDINVESNDTIDANTIIRLNEYISLHLQQLNEPWPTETSSVTILTRMRPAIECLLIKIQLVAWYLWNRCQHIDGRYESYEMEYLRNVGLWQMKLIYFKPVDSKYDHTVSEKIMNRFKNSLLFAKVFGKVLSTMDEKLPHNTNIVDIICIWLDALTHLHRHSGCMSAIVLERSPNDNIMTIIISKFIMNSKYKNYLIDMKSIHLQPIEKFYISTCSFHYAFISKLKNYIEIIAPLIYYSRRFIIYHSESVEQWSTDTLECVRSVATLIMNYYKNIYDRQNSQQKVLFLYDKKYIRCLLRILNCKWIQKNVLSTWSNDETILVDSIIRFLTLIVNHNVKESTKYFLYFSESTHHYNVNELEMRFLLHEMDGVLILFKLLTDHFEYKPLHFNIYMLLIRIIDNNDIRQLNISEQLMSISSNLFSKLSSDDLRKCLMGFADLCMNECIQNEIIKDNQMDLVMNFDQSLSARYDILWTLSFNSNIAKQMKQNLNFLESIRQFIRTDNDFQSSNAIRGILWNIGDHEGLAKFGSKTNKDNFWFDKNVIEIRGFDVVFCYDPADFSECTILQSYLVGNGYRVWMKNPTPRNKTLEHLLLEKEIKANCVILCLSENFIRSNLCRTELQLAFKKQLNIIPVIIHEHYKITCKWLDDIMTTMPDIIDLTKTSYTEAIRLLISTIHKSSNTCQENSFHNPTTPIVYFPCDLYADCKDNNVEKIKAYIKHVPISQINHVESNGSTALHVAAYYGYNELVKLLLKNGASRSIKNVHNLTAFEEARTLATKEIFKRINDEDRFLSNIDINYEWILVCEETFLKREHFRQQLLNTFARNSTDDLSAKFDTVYDRIKEHYIIMLEQENLPQRDRLLIDWFFTKASIEKDPTYIVQAYTSATRFYKILNRHLAMYALEYFHPTLNKSIDYKLVNCLIDIVGIFVHSSVLEKFNYAGQCYRGMLMTKDDISQYTIGSQVINMSLLSTSKQKTIAEIYVGEGQLNSMRQTPDFKLIQFSAVCTYTIRNQHTALDIQRISQIPDEEEILILPFSTFRVTSIKQNDPKKNGILIELELEECC